MSHFVQLQIDHASDLDWVNVDHIVRVHAEAVSAESWVVKVLLTTGAEIIDTRHATREDAELRLIQILPGED